MVEADHQPLRHDSQPYIEDGDFGHALGNPLLDALRQATEGWQEDEQRRNEMSSAFSPSSPTNRFRLGLGENGRGLDIVVTSHDRALAINLTGVPGMRAGGIVELDVRQLDGSPLPAWLDVSSRTLIEGLAPVDLEFVELAVRVVLSDGSTIGKNIRVNSTTGEIEELPDRRTDAGPGDQKRAAAELGDQHIERLGLTLDKATG